MFYKDVTSGIDHTDIETGHQICFQNTGDDDPNEVEIDIVGYLKGDVD